MSQDLKEVKKQHEFFLLLLLLCLFPFSFLIAPNIHNITMRIIMSLHLYKTQDQLTSYGSVDGEPLILDTILDLFLTLTV